MAKKKRRKKYVKNQGSLLKITKFTFKIIWISLKYLWITIKSAYQAVRKLIIHVKSKNESKTNPKHKKSKENLPSIKVIENVKGNYEGFWTKLKEADSLIGLIIGARGSGKTAIALSILEILPHNKKKVMAMGFSSLPKWIKIVDKIDDLENDSYVVIDEGGILFSSRDSMSNSNKLLSELLFVARHKNLTILFISQNSSNLEINTLRQADFMILKKSSLLQKNFERKIIAKIYDDYSDKFDEYKKNKGIALLYSDEFIGFIENELPSFWSTKVSKSFR